jgi:hypothetical protein
LKIGFNQLRLEVYDTSRNFIAEDLNITIYDWNAPIIHYLSPSANLVLLEGEDVEISILVEDEDPGLYEIILDDELVKTGYWTNEIIYLLEKNLTIGIHDITVKIYDHSRNYISHSIQVKVIVTSSFTFQPHARIFGMD